MSEGEVVGLSISCENCVVGRVANPGDIGNAIFLINDSEGVRHFSSNNDQQRLRAIDKGRKVSCMDETGRGRENSIYEQEMHAHGKEAFKVKLTFTSHLVGLTDDGWCF